MNFATSEWTDSQDVVDQERLSVKAALESMRPILEARLQDRLDTLDLAYPQTRCQGCGREGQSQGRRARSWDSTLGELHLERRYFWCQDCESGLSPAQEKVKKREVKNALLYEGSSCAQESESRACILEKKYVSHLGEWKKFAMLVWMEILLLGYDRAKLLVILSDGAEWIRSLAVILPREVMLILDLYHVKKKIWEVGVAIYGEGSQQAVEWSQQQCKRVEEGKASEVIEGLKFLKKSKRRAREKIEGLKIYLENNLDRMDYPRYKAAGLRIGSGGVESMNYHVTGGRLKLQGMRWSEEGARQMASLRADLFNGKWQERTKLMLKAS